MKNTVFCLFQEVRMLDCILRMCISFKGTKCIICTYVVTIYLFMYILCEKDISYTND